MLTTEQLKYWFYIKNNDLYWANSPNNNTKKDTRAGGCGGQGYRIVMFKGKRYLTHRVLWALHHGEWPNGEIDHINGNPRDNRLENLRVVTHQQNCINRKKPSSNTSGFKGVIYCKKSSKYRARIKVDGTYLSLGSFLTPEEASEVYQQIANEWFGNYKRKEY